MEIGLFSHWMEALNAQRNSEDLWVNLDLLEEVRETVRIWMVAYQRCIIRYYNFRVKEKYFQLGDLVLRRVEVGQPTE